MAQKAGFCLVCRWHCLSTFRFGLTTPGARGLVSTSEATGSCSCCGSRIVV